MKVESSDTSFVGHLSELRRRIMFTLIAFIVALCGAFVYVKEIYRWLVRDLDQKLAILAPSDVLWVYLKLAGVVAIAVTLPIAAYQIWQFVKPALEPREQRASLAYIPWLPILFVGGISFGYGIIFPMVLQFLESMSGDFTTMYTADKYFSFILSMTVPFGLLFEMPITVMFLTRIGILNPARLAKARKLSYFSLAVTAVLITPPDIVSDVLVIIPLFLLYEVSVTLSKIVYRKRKKLETVA
ncbi:twin-arginine translocase subunit TatC [Paenibacillus lentus]|uniref:Sec-independent protein translocase protein TatC n=1 Tax=Paenibacillus lentus TaxID=1338368 RepID=A0A3S8RRA8_9BACL|nr:twin-arginine translocase subunit TatC [Paenibacillus lentus]AZK45387.1 twin-arginine translocase subunit TatC [Paenibacillus lentus]